MIFLVWAGCSVLTESIPYDHHLPSRKTTPESVAILDKYPEKTYVEVAKVEAESTVFWVSWQTLHEKLREEAARLGADAVVNLNPPGEPDDHIEVTGIGWVDYLLKPPRHVSAIAIRYI
jgi:hypothetical protein